MCACAQYSEGLGLRAAGYLDGRCQMRGVDAGVTCVPVLSLV